MQFCNRPTFTVISIALVLALSTTTAAQTNYTWTGLVSTEWTDALNWTQLNYPGALDDNAVVTIDSTGTGNPDLSSDLPYAVWSVDVNDRTLTVSQGGRIRALDAFWIEPDSDLIIESGGKVTIADALSLRGRLDVQASGGLHVDGFFNLAEGSTCELIADGSVVIEPGAVFTVLADTTLKIKGHGFHIAGNVHLSTATSRIRVTNDTTFGALKNSHGRVKGFSNSARLQIARPATGTIRLTNKIRVAGAMVIEPYGEGDGDAVFCNMRAAATPKSGQVNAELQNGVLELASGLIVEDDDIVLNSTLYRPQWRAWASGAVLQFQAEAGQTSLLKGDFDLANDGTLGIDQDVSTSGSLTQTAGTSVDVAAGHCFAYDTFSFICN